MTLIPRGSVSEKSLELNVTAEIVEAARSRLGKVLAIGYTTRQEARNGLDVTIEGAGRIIAALQFKAPKRATTLGRAHVYTYRIASRPNICQNPQLCTSGNPFRCPREAREILNKLRSRGLAGCITQHLVLLQTSIVLEKYTRRRLVYYALPLAADYQELQQKTPGLLDHTVLIDVQAFPPHTFIDCKPHRIYIEVDPASPNKYTVTIESKPIRLPSTAITTARELLDKLLAKPETLPKTPLRATLTASEAAQALLEKLLAESSLETQRAKEIAETIAQLVSYTYRGIAILTEEPS